MATAAELRTQLAEAEAIERADMEVKTKRKNEAWGQLRSNKLNWDWETKHSPNHRSWMGRETPLHDAEYEACNVHRRIRSEVYAKFVAEYGEVTTSNSKPDQWEGMTYYRTKEGILDHDSGGTYVLWTPMLCSVEEWEQIIDGNIPLKFVR